MECKECHERPATLHFTQFINGHLHEVHVCEHCAKKHGYQNQQEDVYSLHDLLTGLFHMNHSNVGLGNESFIRKKEVVTCPTCQLTFEQFQKKGKFGCATCYEVFQPKLSNVLKRVHSGNTKHAGKIPVRKRKEIYAKREIAQLRLQLKELIDGEEFEQAAIIRDEIRKLESLKGGEQS